MLSVMVDDTKNCDEVGEHLQKIAPELAGKVLEPKRSPFNRRERDLERNMERLRQ